MTRAYWGGAALLLICSASAHAGSFKTSAEASAAADAAKDRFAAKTACMQDIWKENDQNNREAQKAAQKVADLIEQKKQAIRELSQGFYCSKCYRTKSEIERQEHMSFYQHLQNVQGHPVPAPAEVVRQKAQQFDQQIRSAKQALAQYTVKYQGLKAHYDQCSADRSAAWSAEQSARDWARYLAAKEKQAAAAAAFRKMMEAKERERKARQAAIEAERARRRAEAEARTKAIVAELERRRAESEQAMRKAVENLVAAMSQFQKTQGDALQSTTGDRFGGDDPLDADARAEVEVQADRVAESAAPPSAGFTESAPGAETAYQGASDAAQKPAFDGASAESVFQPQDPSPTFDSVYAPADAESPSSEPAPADDRQLVASIIGGDENGADPAPGAAYGVAYDSHAATHGYDFADPQTAQDANAPGLRDMVHDIAKEEVTDRVQELAGETAKAGVESIKEDHPILGDLLEKGQAAWEKGKAIYDKGKQIAADLDVIRSPDSSTGDVAEAAGDLAAQGTNDEIAAHDLRFVGNTVGGASDKLDRHFRSIIDDEPLEEEGAREQQLDRRFSDGNQLLLDLMPERIQNTYYKWADRYDRAVKVYDRVSDLAARTGDALQTLAEPVTSRVQSFMASFGDFMRGKRPCDEEDLCE